MYFEELIKHTYITLEPPTDDEVVLLPEGCRPQIDHNLVVTRADFEEVLMTHRASDPVSEAILMTIGRSGIALNDPVWDTLLQREIVKDRFTALCNAETEQRLSVLPQDEPESVPDTTLPAGDVGPVAPFVGPAVEPVSIEDEHREPVKEPDFTTRLLGPAEIERMLSGESLPSSEVPDESHPVVPGFEIDVIGMGTAGDEETELHEEEPSALQFPAGEDGMGLYVDSLQQNKPYAPEVSDDEDVEDAPAPGSVVGLSIEAAQEKEAPAPLKHEDDISGPMSFAERGLPGPAALEETPQGFEPPSDVLPGGLGFVPPADMPLGFEPNEAQDEGEGGDESIPAGMLGFRPDSAAYAPASVEGGEDRDVAPGYGPLGFEAPLEPEYKVPEEVEPADDKEDEDDVPGGGFSFGIEPPLSEGEDVGEDDVPSDAFRVGVDPSMFGGGEVVTDKKDILPDVEAPVAPDFNPVYDVPGYVPSVSEKDTPVGEEQPAQQQDVPDTNTMLQSVRDSFNLFHSLVKKYGLGHILRSENLDAAQFCSNLTADFPQFVDQYGASLRTFPGDYERAACDLVQSLQLEAESAIFKNDLDRAERCIAPVYKLIYM